MCDRAGREGAKQGAQEISRPPPLSSSPLLRLSPAPAALLFAAHMRSVRPSAVRRRATWPALSSASTSSAARTIAACSGVASSTLPSLCAAVAGGCARVCVKGGGWVRCVLERCVSVHLRGNQASLRNPAACSPLCPRLSPSSAPDGLYAVGRCCSQRVGELRRRRLLAIGGGPAAAWFARRWCCCCWWWRRCRCCCCRRHAACVCTAAAGSRTAALRATAAAVATAAAADAARAHAF